MNSLNVRTAVHKDTPSAVLVDMFSLFHAPLPGLPMMWYDKAIVNTRATDCRLQVRNAAYPSSTV